MAKLKQYYSSTEVKEVKKEKPNSHILENGKWIDRAMKSRKKGVNKETLDSWEFWYSEDLASSVILVDRFHRLFQASLDRSFKPRSIYAGTPFNTIVKVSHKDWVKGYIYIYVDWNDEVLVYNTKQKLKKISASCAKNTFKTTLEFNDEERIISIKLEDPSIFK